METVLAIAAGYTGRNIDEFVLHLVTAGVSSFDSIWYAACEGRWCQTSRGIEFFKSALRHWGFTVTDDTVSV